MVSQTLGGGLEKIFLYDDEVLYSIERVYGDLSREVLYSLTRPPRRLYLRVNTLRTSREEVLDLIESEGYRAYPDEILPEAVYFEVEGPVALEDTGHRVVVDKRTAESVMMGANVYIPGVLWCDRSIKRGSWVSVFSENGVLVAEGEAVVSCDDVSRDARGVFVKTHKTLYRAPPVRELAVWSMGLVYPQSLPSMIVSRVLGPRPGEVVVDMCAAPGGKTGHIHELSGGEAVVYAFDHSSSRLREMRENLARLGHSRNIYIHRADSRYISRDYPYLRADKVLLDPPCTSTGVRPKIYDRKTGRDLRSLVDYQIQFAREAHRVLREGGVLVYSTCSITYDENEGLVERLVEEGLYEELDPAEFFDKIYVHASRGLGGVGARFSPHRYEGPGYFIAVLRKRG